MSGALTSTGRLTGLRRIGAAPAPGAAHGTHPVGRAGLGSGRAHARAPPRRLHLVHPHGSPTSCSSPSGTPRRPSLGVWGTTVDLVLDYPGHAARGRRHARPRHGRGHVGQEGPRAGCATSRGTCIHLYAYLGAGLALPHQLWTGGDFLGLPGSHRVLVGAVGAQRRRRPRLPCRAAALALLQRLAARGRRARRGPGRHDRDGRRPRRGADAGARRSVLPVALPRRPRLVAGQPVLALGRAGRCHAALHGGPRRRRVPAPGHPAAGHPRAGRGALRPPPRRRAHPAQGAAHGFRHRHHPAAGHAGGPRPGTRRRHGHPPGPLAPGGGARRRDRGARRRSGCPLPARRGSSGPWPGQLAARAGSPPHRRRRAARDRARHRRPRRLPLRRRRLDDRRRGPPPGLPVCPRDHVHLERFTS